VADEAPRDATRGTVGWFVFAAGTVGVTAGQTVRVSVVNLSPVILPLHEVDRSHV